MLAIDPQSGAIRWSTTLSTGGQSVWLIGTGDGVVVVTWYQNLAAIDARSGQVRWHHAAGASNEAIPAAISNGRVFVVTLARPCQDSD